MKLQSKILVTIVPLAAAAMLGLGLLSMNIATDGVHKGAVRYLEAVLDTYIADSLESRHRLLVENGIADVPSFVRRYQAEAAKAADSVPWHWPGHIFVLSDTGSLVFDTGGANAAVLQKAMRPVVLRAVAERASDISGAITEIPEDELFVGKRYQPWNWYVFSAIPSDVLSDTVMDIRNVTTGVTAATIAAFVLVLGFVSRRYLVNPISTLKDAASQVAANSPVHDIPLHTKDELGSLARSMETMSAELERHEKNLLGFQAKLEERIVERTAELEERNAELESEIAVRKDVQRRLAESESRYRGLFDNMIAGFAYHRIIYDENGEAADYEFIMANPAFEEQTGLPHKDIIGRRVTEVLPGLKDDPVDWIGIFAQVAAEGEAKHFEAYSEPLSRWYLASAFSDKPGYFGVMALDITERKRAEREVERARLDAEAANLAKSEFLANMSHEIRTPLNGALGMLQLLETTDLDKEQDEYVHIAMRSSRNLLTVINDILDLSCVEAGKLELRDETFDVAEAVRTAAAVFRGPAEEKGLDLDIRVSEDMPPALNGDSGRLRQILFNLIGNAIKFTISGTIRVETWPLYSANGKPLRLLFKVSDTGVGIPEHKQARIHEPFTQADGSYRRRFQGAGLGLSIVARLTKLMGGSLCFDSREGRGTDFYLRLDFSVEKQAGEDRSAAEGTLPVCENSRPVLLVEDDPVNRLTLRRMLDNMGYATHLAENGKQALAELEKQRFCCVLMDVQMPVMDGVSATRELRGAAMNHPNRDVPVVALTAHAMSGDREQFLSAGMTDYLAKPVNMKDLADALQRAIAEQRA